MRLCSFTRLLAAAGTVLLAGASARAFAAADVTVVLNAPADDTGPLGINVGATNDFTADITNAGSDTATNVVLTVTQVGAPLEIQGFKGCARSATDPTSCTISSLPGVAPGNTNTTTVTISLDYPLPTTLTCPNGATVGPFTVSVVADNDTSAATSGVTSDVVNDYADMTAVVTPAEQGISSGVPVSMHGVVTNNGPCAVTAAVADFVYPTALSFTSATDGTPPFCSVDAIADAFNNFGCKLGPLAVGESRSFDATFTLASLPKDLTNGAYRLEVDASSELWDPLPDNSSGIGTGRYSHDVGMCSIGGAGSVLSLLSLLALRLRRRRAS